MQKVLTEEEEDRQDSETDSNFSPASVKKKTTLGELNPTFSATLTEPGQQKPGGSSPSFKRRRSPLLNR